VGTNSFSLYECISGSYDALLLEGIQVDFILIHILDFTPQNQNQNF
jgi:hypothetical protein